jgi:hypothetical protein
MSAEVIIVDGSMHSTAWMATFLKKIGCMMVLLAFRHSSFAEYPIKGTSYHGRKTKKTVIRGVVVRCGEKASS